MKKFALYLRVVLAFVLLAIAVNGIAQEVSKRTLVDIQNAFSPSGWMGDGRYERKYVSFSGACQVNPFSPPDCIKIEYTFGPQRWAGIYWLNQPDNWCNLPGNNYSKNAFTHIRFLARGETGKEVVEFKAGGVDCPGEKYRDSFVGGCGRIALTNQWKQYEIDLRGTNLSSVIGGFCWVASADYNTQDKIVFYLDDIILE